MTLDTQQLQNALGDFFIGTSPLPATVDEAGTAWASVYRRFAETAQADPTAPTRTSLDAAASSLAFDLAESFRSTNQADGLTLSMAKAFSEFWPRVRFQAKLQSGEVFATGEATSPDSQQLQRDLKALFAAGDLTADPLETARQQAGRMASLLGAWTHTVTVVNTINGQVQPAVALA